MKNTTGKEIGTRIRDLRKWLRISQTTVGDFLGIPRTAVSALEASKREIGATELIRLSRLFRCDPNSLFGLKPTPVDEAKDIEFQARINNANTTIDEHDKKELTNFSVALKALLHNMAPNRLNAVELVKSKIPQIAAEEFSKKLKLEPPVDIYSILIQVGLYPRFSALNGLAGALVRSQLDEKQIYGVLINSDQMEERMRFSAAHELAHYVLEHLNKKEVVHASPKARWRDAVESDADSFAAELLMPKEFLQKYFSKHSGQIDAMEVISLADELQVSYQAILHRLLELGHISKVDFESFSSEKPTELREVLKSQRKSKKARASKAFNPKDIESLYQTIEQYDSFINSPDCIRWLQEAAYLEYCRNTTVNDRASDVKDVYEKVAIWMAEKNPHFTL